MNLLIIATISCALEYIVPIFIKYATTRFYTVTKHDLELWKDLINLKQEMSGINIVNEFAKYAKLQRQYNKIDGILKEKAIQCLASRMEIQLYASYGFYLLNGFSMLVLSYFYKNTPVIVFPKGMLWPIQNLLSWPCYVAQEDSISFLMWVIITRLVVSICKKVNIT